MLRPRQQPSELPLSRQKPPRPHGGSPGTDLFFFLVFTTNRFYTERIYCSLPAFTENLSYLSSGRFYTESVQLVLWPLLHQTWPTTFTQNLFYLATTTTSAHFCTEPVLLSSGCPVVTLNLFYLSFFASLTLNYSYLSSGHFYTEHILLHLWPILH